MASSDMMAPPYSDPPPKRKVKDFPPELAWVTDQDRHNFVLVMEVDTNKKSNHFGTDQLVAQSVKVNINNVDRVVDLNSLVVDHLRRLCKNLGITHTGSLSKFEIRKTIASFFQGMENLEQSGITPTTVASRRTSTILRLVNVIFSNQFIEDLLKVNDAKSRQDHETFKTYKDFWIRATIAHNSCVDSDNDVAVSPPPRRTNERPRENDQDEDEEDRSGIDEENDDDAGGVAAISASNTAAADDDVSSTGTADNEEVAACRGDDFSTLVIPDNDEILAALASDRCINLLQVNQFETQAFRNKVLSLFKMRRTIQENMSVSGTHNHVVWDFVEGALQKKGSSGITKIVLYYFYMRCEEVADIDSHFQPFLDRSMIGDTSGPLDDDIGVASQSDVSALSLSGRKHGRNSNSEASGTTAAVEAYLMTANENQTALLKCLSEAAHDRKRKLKLTKRKMEIDARNNRFEKRLQIATALKCTDELNLLLQEVKSGFNDDNDDDSSKSDSDNCS